MSGNNSRRDQKAGSGLTSPLCRLPRVCLNGHTVGGPNSIQLYSSTQEATQFGDSICPICISTFKCLFNIAQPTRAIIDIGGGYHLEALNFRSDHSSSFPSSILSFPLFAPSGLQLCHSFDHLAKPHRTSIDRKGPITSGFQPLVFYRQPIQLSIAYYRLLLS
jgi:hypothetical protein